MLRSIIDEAHRRPSDMLSIYLVSLPSARLLRRMGECCWRPPCSLRLPDHLDRMHYGSSTVPVTASTKPAGPAIT